MEVVEAEEVARIVVGAVRTHAQAGVKILVREDVVQLVQGDVKEDVPLHAPAHVIQAVSVLALQPVIQAAIQHVWVVRAHVWVAVTILVCIHVLGHVRHHASA